MIKLTDLINEATINKIDVSKKMESLMKKPPSYLKKYWDENAYDGEPSFEEIPIKLLNKYGLTLDDMNWMEKDNHKEIFANLERGKWDLGYKHWN